jgi:hypothetical protein
VAGGAVVNVSVLLYVPALALPGMTIARLGLPPGSAAKSHSPWPVPAGALSIVTGVVLSTCAARFTGPLVAGLPVALVAVPGVSVIDAPVPAAVGEPLTVGALALTLTL